MYKTTEGKETACKSYDESMKLWDVAYREEFVETNYGKSHVIISGEDNKQALIILPGLFGDASMWFPNVGELSKHYANDTSKGAPICRWVYQDILVDVIPSDSDVLGFSNMWYEEGIENKISKTLPDGTEIFVFPPEYYLATKIEAHKGRGGKDLRQSHDFEDIIYILDNCSELLENITNANESVKAYLKEECSKLLKNEGLTEGIESALPYGSEEEATEIIMELIQNIADIE